MCQLLHPYIQVVFWYTVGSHNNDLEMHGLSSNAVFTNFYTAESNAQCWL